MSNVATLKQPAAEPPLYLDRKEALNAIPTNWCDSILTGPDAALPKGGVYNGTDIANLLLAVKARLEALLTFDTCENCHALLDSRAEACPHCD